MIFQRKEYYFDFGLSMYPIFILLKVKTILKAGVTTRLKNIYQGGMGLLPDFIDPKLLD